MTTRPLFPILMTVLTLPATAVAQDPSPDAEAQAALQRCAAAAEAEDREAALAGAEKAEALFTSLVEAHPDDPAPLVGQARVLTGCRIRFAPFMEQGVIVGKSNGFLERALELDPTHWEARYVLALNHYFTPEFLGRTKDSIEHLEILLEQQGDRTDFPEMAGPYAYLGDLYLRVDREEDAVAIWRKGVALFPDDPRLAERLAKVEEMPAAPPPEEAQTSAVSPEPALAEGDTVQAAPIEVRIEGGYTMDDARPTATLSRIDVYTAPGGTADILQVFQMLPGVTRASEGSDLYVRGGDPAETPVLVDGGRLLYPGVFETLHGGVFGILDPSVLARAYFSSGGFSARYGDALSGVVELETDGRPSVASWRAGWNFAGGGATLRQPLGASAGGWATMRATETSLLLLLHGDDDFESVPRSIEGAAGVTWDVRPGLEGKAMALLMGDHSAREVDAIGWRGPFESTGRTALGLATLRAISADATRSIQATASWNERRSDFEFGVLDRGRRDRSMGMRLEGEIAPSAGRLLRAGLEARRLVAREEGTVPTTERIDPGAPAEPLTGLDETTWHAGAWLEGELRPLDPLAVVLGARIDRLPGETGATVDPRVAVAWRTGDWTLRAGAGEFRQGRWRVGYELPDGGAPDGIPRRARHLALGAEREGAPWIKVEGYLKAYDDYIVEGEAGPPASAGRAAGLDAIARWTGTERWDGWLSYSLLHGRVELEDGRTVSSDYDVTHSLTAVGRVNFGPWQIGLTGRYATGRPYTPILGAQAGAGPLEPVYGEPNAARLPTYFRLDGRVTRFFRLGSGYLVAYVEMLNLTDRGNASAVVYDANWENPRTVDSFFADRTFVAGFELQP
ncbi:MAG: TonB-dependent receptor domain-containing protein [Gemmatimonadota bacterium]